MSVDYIPQPKTFVYDPKHDTKLDAYLPTKYGVHGKVPTLVHFHGGGIVTGSRNDGFFIPFLREELPAKGILVISADYRLLLPSTADDILQDVHTVFHYVGSHHTKLAQYLSSANLSVDPARIIVSGASGGNYPAKAAATLSSVVPRPLGWLDFYGEGGDWLSDFWVKPYDVIPHMAYYKYDEAKAEELERTKGGGKVISDSPVIFGTDLVARDLDNRFGLFAHWLKNGTTLDNLLLSPGLGAKLAQTPHSERLSLVPADKQHLLLPITPETCPAYLVHGTADGMVPVEDSKAIERDMKEFGLRVGTDYVGGAAHGLRDPKTRAPVGSTPAIVQGVLKWIDELVEVRQ
ncbi:hypothetical protein L202_05623 [Cryptococcus amylolentus CBS 6039]|uniref:BD-FAE-like domain-containing protein n=2 Tax=Cryptococcus amylolentus TaxID=104669 RepID=A0A1E3HMY3_9TREE|nr:hypothetical protein L202_05623 [Cryptococcus amylolentus CBS 6039]ODN77086.1 hypothetical protein L202_05623 [Cryptococcus amylolentus CBS 6039]ODO04940.1 hypothetical protein I350_05551 [Cryptococcus amylolentus CBS 6273]